MVLNLQRECMRTTNSVTHKLTKMNNHKDELTKRYWLIKRESKAQRNSGDGQLTIMVNASQDAIKRLEQVKEKMNKIMQMAEICRKYEHLTDDSLLKDVDTNGAPVDFENLDGAMIKECKEYSKMDKFLLKMNRVRVQTICLKAEKAKLAKENVQLKLYIKRYLTELALRGNKSRPQSMQIQSELQKIDVNGKTMYVMLVSRNKCLGSQCFHFYCK
ncbi:unnamed protein product [Diatraea saccharalis]|uniref:Uncharacterized protein n=1 Tax=Diatraea saccharalis TaxID=40085 RepID=A0A9N9QZN7_9NEOP|nr:unnamed protein product [Diatraea saccharalis]